jgi:hypothetical protein
VRGTTRLSPQITNLGDSRWELRTKKRRGGSGERASVPLWPHVNSGPDPALYSARKISGRPCVPGRLGKNRAQADSLRLGGRWKSGMEDDGMVEYWNSGIVGCRGRRPVPLTHRSSIPLFYHSNPPVPLRWWAALPGFPPTQGLPEIFHSDGTDRSEADAPREEKGTTRHSPEPPLLFVVFGGYWMHRNGRSAIMVVVR